MSMPRTWHGVRMRRARVGRDPEAAPRPVTLPAAWGDAAAAALAELAPPDAPASLTAAADAWIRPLAARARGGAGPVPLDGPAARAAAAAPRRAHRPTSGAARRARRPASCSTSPPSPTRRSASTSPVSPRRPRPPRRRWRSPPRARHASRSRSPISPDCWRGSGSTTLRPRRATWRPRSRRCCAGGSMRRWPRAAPGPRHPPRAPFPASPPPPRTRGRGRRECHACRSATASAAAPPPACCRRGRPRRCLASRPGAFLRLSRRSMPTAA